jgi:Holin of 3TMs, for gene-transfer release
MGLLDTLTGAASTTPMGALLNVGSKILDRVLPDPAANAAAKAELLKMEQEGELARLANETKLYETEQNNLTKRLEADMASDSWLSKNIRPMTLIFLLLAYSGFAVASMFNYETRGAYVELLGQWGMLVMSFYFGGRTLEKIADRVKK